MEEHRMVRILLRDDGAYKVENAPSYLGTYRFYGTFNDCASIQEIEDAKLCIGQVCKQDKWIWHLRRLISSVIKENNKKISTCKKSNAKLEKLKKHLDEYEEKLKSI